MNAPPTSSPSTTSVTPGPQPLYHEEQRFRQWWLWVVILVPAALAWWPFIQQVIGGRPLGQDPAPGWLVVLLWLFIGLGLPAAFGYVALLIDVTEDEVRIHYRPLTRRAIRFADIQAVEARPYNALKEYGGWGIKGWSRAKMAYNVNGGRGAELTLVDGRKVMLGSQRSDELAAVIAGRLRPADDPPPMRV